MTWCPNPHATRAASRQDVGRGTPWLIDAVGLVQLQMSRETSEQVGPTQRQIQMRLLVCICAFAEFCQTRTLANQNPSLELWTSCNETVNGGSKQKRCWKAFTSWEKRKRQLLRCSSGISCISSLCNVSACQGFIAPKTSLYILDACLSAAPACVHILVEADQLP